MFTCSKWSVDPVHRPRDNPHIPVIYSWGSRRQPAMPTDPYK